MICFSQDSIAYHVGISQCFEQFWVLKVIFLQLVEESRHEINNIIAQTEISDSVHQVKETQ